MYLSFMPPVCPVLLKNLHMNAVLNLSSPPRHCYCVCVTDRVAFLPSSTKLSLPVKIFHHFEVTLLRLLHYDYTISWPLEDDQVVEYVKTL